MGEKMEEKELNVKGTEQHKMREMLIWRKGKVRTKRIDRKEGK